MAKPYDLNDDRELRLAALDRAIAAHGNVNPGALGTVISASVFERYLRTGQTTDTPGVRIEGNQVVSDAPRRSSWP